MTYQSRAAIRSLQHTARALACLVLADKRATAHFAAARIWSELVVMAGRVVKLGLVSQEKLDAIWIEPPPMMGAEEEVVN